LKLSNFSQHKGKIKNQFGQFFSSWKTLIKLYQHETESTLKISYVQTLVLKRRKSDDFQELHKNDPEMAVLM